MYKRKKVKSLTSQVRFVLITLFVVTLLDLLSRNFGFSANMPHLAWGEYDAGQ
jgi:hypothetical protein